MSASFPVRRSPQAWGWLFGASAVQALLYAVAHNNPAWMLHSRGEWQNRELMVLFSMVLLLLAAFVMHGVDKKRGHGGFLDVYKTTNPGHQTQEQKFVGPVLTVESVRAAMTAGILAILLDDREEYLGAPPTETPYWHSIETLINSPNAVFFLLITGALAASLMTTMAALLCYEYATRFDWKLPSPPKTSLLQKGFHFGKFGFYCLMWSLAVVPALLDHRLVFLSILFVFVIMWIYYFFPVQPPPAPAAPQAKEPPAAEPREAAPSAPQTAAAAVEQRATETPGESVAAGTLPGG